jgi:hypothetical protein
MLQTQIMRKVGIKKQQEFGFADYGLLLPELNQICARSSLRSSQFLILRSRSKPAGCCFVYGATNLEEFVQSLF